MEIVVFGATGVLGRALVPLLRERGHAVVAAARDVERAALLFPFARVARADLLTDDERALAAVVPPAACVVHAATAIPADGTRPGAWDANTRLRTEGTRRLLAAARAAGASAYVQQSIVMAYRDGGDAWLDESTPLDESPERSAVCGPVAEMERRVAEAGGELRTVTLRCGQFVGPGTFQDDLVRALRRGQAVIAGDGDQFVSPVHVQDVAAAFAAAVERGPGGAVFNVADEPLRHGGYADALADRLGVPRARRDLARPRPPSFRCSSARAREVLGWRPTRGIWPA